MNQYTNVLSKKQIVETVFENFNFIASLAETSDLYREPF